MTGLDEEAKKKIEAEKQRMADLPTFLEINPKQYREEDNYGQYEHFLDHYATKLVDFKKVGKRYNKETPNEWMTIAEEAFCLVALENYHDVIHGRVNLNKAVPSKYTKQKDAKRNQGYSDEGIDRYNEIYQIVKAYWEEDTLKEKRGEITFGERYLQGRKKKLLEREAKIQKRKEAATKRREHGWNDAKGFEELPAEMKMLAKVANLA